ncbi:hypothetical protein TNIN_188111 [Trichonephila inaurata madagascariensis]|uniref:Uncharacterized protein n=1 Tax=Trichonephila inaurata madagascariensis TaxID=2747483 RepID=A0A8X6X1J9_9ARAC|nr:hypothetical protein TNIN_188111 [Trichonephila inaurata madagascariensis]
MSSDVTLDSSYDSDDESELYFSDFEKLVAQSTSDVAGAKPGQSSSPAKKDRSETEVGEKKASVKTRKKKRNLGIFSHIKRLRKAVFHRQPILESSSQCKFKVIKREGKIRKSTESKSPILKHNSPPSSLTEVKEKYEELHESKVSSSKEESPLDITLQFHSYTKRPPESLPQSSKYVPLSSTIFNSSSSEDDSKRKKLAKRPSELQPQSSKYVPLSSTTFKSSPEDDSKRKKSSKKPSEYKISTSECASPPNDFKDRKKKYTKRARPSTLKHASSPNSPCSSSSLLSTSSSSSSSSSGCIEEKFEDYSKLPDSERLRKYCAEFLQFQRLRFSNLKVTESKLILNMDTTNSIINNSMKVCMKMVDFRHNPPETKECIEYENNSLLYIIGKSSSIFEELSQHVNEMTQEMIKFIKDTDDALKGSSFLLENVIKTLSRLNTTD